MLDKTQFYYESEPVGIKIEKGKITLINFWKAEDGFSRGLMDYSQLLIDRNPQWKINLDIICLLFAGVPKLEKKEEKNYRKKMIDLIISRKWLNAKHYFISQDAENYLQSKYDLTTTSYPFYLIVGTDQKIKHYGSPMQAKIENKIEALIKQNVN